MCSAIGVFGTINNLLGRVIGKGMLQCLDSAGLTLHN